MPLIQKPGWPSVWPSAQLGRPGGWWEVGRVSSPSLKLSFVFPGRRETWQWDSWLTTDLTGLPETSGVPKEPRWAEVTRSCWKYFLLLRSTDLSEPPSQPGVGNREREEAMMHMLLPHYGNVKTHVIVQFCLNSLSDINFYRCGGERADMQIDNKDTRC